MAYGVKYRLKADTVKYKSEIIIDIEQLDYAGDITNKYIGAGGIALTKDGDGKICGTSLTFSIQSDSNFEYLLFFESDPHEFKVKLYKDSVCVWTGWLIPDEYHEEFISPPYDVHILANDGLGLLKNSDYTSESTVTNHIVRLDSIKKILDTIGLGLSVETAYDVNGSYLSVPLDLFGYVYFRDDYFWNYSCYDVLEKILPPDCTITQHKNKWLIRRNEQDSEKTHYTWEASPPTWTNTTGAGESVLDLAVIGAGDVYPIGAAEMNMLHSWNSAIIRSELGQRESFCINYNFRDGLTGWTQSTTGFATAQNDENGTYVKLTGEHEETSEDVPVECISQSFYYVAEEGHGFMLKLRYSITGYLVLLGIGAYKKTQFVVKGRVKIVSGGDTYYLDETHGWTTDNKNFEISDYGNIAGISWKDYTIYTDEPPVANGTMTVYLYAGGEWPSTTLVDVNFTDVVVKPYIASSYSNGQVYDIPMKTNGTDTGEVNILPTDAPDIANFDLLFYNGQTYSGNRIADYVANGALTNSYVNILINSLVWLHGVTRQIISGYFRGPNLHLNAVIQSAVTSSRKYIVKSGTWDVLGDKYQLELLEIPGTASGSTWAVANTDYSAYGDWWPEDGGISSGGGGMSGGGGGGGSDSGYVTISWLDQYFEIVNEGTTGEYIRCLKDFGSTGEIFSFNFGDTTGNGIHLWAGSTTGAGVVMIGTGLEFGESGAVDLSVATTGTLGGVIVGDGLSITTGGLLSVTGGSSNCDFSISTITGSTYTLTLDDSYLRFTNNSGCTVIIPLNSSVNFAVPTVITMEQSGEGEVTVEGETTGVVINAYDGKSTYGQYAGLQIIQVENDVWTCIAGQG